MSIAENARRSIDDLPLLRVALQAGVLNYAETARLLDLDPEVESTATALRRYREELPALEFESIPITVRFHRGCQLVTDAPEGSEVIVQFGEQIAIDGGDMTVITIRGLEPTLGVGNLLVGLASHDVTVQAMTHYDDHLAVAVSDRDATTAVRRIETWAEQTPRMQ